MMGEAEAAWREANPEPTTEDLSLVEAWLRLQAGMEAETQDTGDRRLELSERQSRYQSLLRSCATMALYNIDVAVARMLEDGHDVIRVPLPSRVNSSSSKAPCGSRTNSMRVSLRGRSLFGLRPGYAVGSPCCAALQSLFSGQ